MKTILKAAKNRFAPYVTYDCYGTMQREWTLGAAVAWFPYCSPVAVVFNTYTRREVAVRVQGA